MGLTVALSLKPFLFSDKLNTASQRGPAVAPGHSLRVLPQCPLPPAQQQPHPFPSPRCVCKARISPPNPARILTRPGGPSDLFGWVTLKLLITSPSLSKASCHYSLARALPALKLWLVKHRTHAALPPADPDLQGTHREFSSGHPCTGFSGIPVKSPLTLGCF